MKILFLAPQPFYQHRGSPIAIKLVLEVLAERGDSVDTLVYPEGEEIALPGISLSRTPDLPFLRNIRPGFSWKKLVCDTFMLLLALRKRARTRYDLVHAVEESVFIALLLKALWGTPYIYDMDSSLPEQLIEKHPRLKFLMPFMRRMEQLAVRHALVVVPVCDALCDTVRPYQPNRVTVLYDSPLPAEPCMISTMLPTLRERPQDCLVVYVGNLEPYQGIDLLLESFALAQQKVPELRLAIVGGRTDDIALYSQKSQDLALDAFVRFIGARPVTELSGLLAQADILVSPRIHGSNTPMKIYSYLESGKPILATSLKTHTQVLDDQVAVLAQPTQQEFADGLVLLAREKSRWSSLGEAGKQLVSEKYSYQAFHQTFTSLMNDVQETIMPAAHEESQTFSGT